MTIKEHIQLSCPDIEGIRHVLLEGQRLPVLQKLIRIVRLKYHGSPSLELMLVAVLIAFLVEVLHRIAIELGSADLTQVFRHPQCQHHLSQWEFITTLMIIGSPVLVAGISILPVILSSPTRLDNIHILPEITTEIRLNRSPCCLVLQALILLFNPDKVSVPESVEEPRPLIKVMREQVDQFCITNHGSSQLVTEEMTVLDTRHLCAIVKITTRCCVRVVLFTTQYLCSDPTGFLSLVRRCEVRSVTATQWQIAPEGRSQISRTRIYLQQTVSEDSLSQSAITKGETETRNTVLFITIEIELAERLATQTKVVGVERGGIVRIAEFGRQVRRITIFVIGQSTDHTTAFICRSIVVIRRIGCLEIMNRDIGSIYTIGILLIERRLVGERRVNGIAKVDGEQHQTTILTRCLSRHLIRLLFNGTAVLLLFLLLLSKEIIHLGSDARRCLRGWLRANGALALAVSLLRRLIDLLLYLRHLSILQSLLYTDTPDLPTIAPVAFPASLITSLHATRNNLGEVVLRSPQLVVSVTCPHVVTTGVDLLFILPDFPLDVILRRISQVSTMAVQ